MTALSTLDVWITETCCQMQEDCVDVRHWVFVFYLIYLINVCSSMWLCLWKDIPALSLSHVGQTCCEEVQRCLQIIPKLLFTPPNETLLTWNLHKLQSLPDDSEVKRAFYLYQRGAVPAAEPTHKEIIKTFIMSLCMSAHHASPSSCMCLRCLWFIHLCVRVFPLASLCVLHTRMDLSWCPYACCSAASIP